MKIKAILIDLDGTINGVSAGRPFAILIYFKDSLLDRQTLCVIIRI